MQGSGNYPLPLGDSQCSVPHGWFQGLSLGSFFSLSLWHIPWHMVSRAPSASARGWLEEPWTSNISVWHHPLAQTFHNSSSAAAHSKPSSRAVIFTQQPEGEKREEREEMGWVITQWTAAEVSNAIPIFVLPTQWVSQTAKEIVPRIWGPFWVHLHGACPVPSPLLPGCFEPVSCSSSYNHYQLYFSFFLFICWTFFTS